MSVTACDHLILKPIELRRKLARFASVLKNCLSGESVLLPLQFPASVKSGCSGLSPFRQRPVSVNDFIPKGVHAVGILQEIINPFSFCRVDAICMEECG